MEVATSLERDCSMKEILSYVAFLLKPDFLLRLANVSALSDEKKGLRLALRGTAPIVLKRRRKQRSEKWSGESR